MDSAQSGNPAHLQFAKPNPFPPRGKTTPLNIRSTPMSVSRREFLAGACAAGTAGLLAATGETAAAATRDSQLSPDPLGSFSFVHLTDQHVTHRRHAPEGYAKCIAAINAIKPVP